MQSLSTCISLESLLNTLSKLFMGNEQFIFTIFEIFLFEQKIGIVARPASRKRVAALLEM